MILYVLLKWIIIFEFSSWIVHGVPNIMKIIIYYRIKKWIKKNLPDTWTYDLSFFTLKSKEAFISAKKINSKGDGIQIINGKIVMSRTTDYIKHNYGKNIKSSLLDNIILYDNEFDSVQFKRNKALNDLLK